MFTEYADKIRGANERERERESKPLRGFVKFFFSFIFFLTLFFTVNSSVHATSSLPTGITSFWKLEEASGTRADEVGTNVLGVSGSVSSATGKIGNAADISSPNYLTINDNASLKTGNTDFSVSAWIYLHSTSGTQVFVSKFKDISGEWALYLTGSKFVFATYATGGPGAGYSATANSFGIVSINTWYHVVGVHNYATNKNYIYVNNDTPDSADSVEHVGTTGPFQIGAFNGGAIANARIDAVGFWKKTLSSSEVAELYNSGNGIEYPFNPPTLTTQAASQYNCHCEWNNHSNRRNQRGD